MGGPLQHAVNSTMTHPSPARPTQRILTAVALAALLGAWGEAAAQEGPAVSEVELLRSRPRLSVGMGVQSGSTAFTSDPLLIKTDLGQVPTAAVGLRVWVDEAAGFDLSYQGGFFGGIEVSQLEAVEGDATLRLTLHRLEGGFRYRFFSSPRPDAVEFGPRLGFVMNSVIFSDHTPNLLVDTTTFGPQVGAFVRVPLFGAALGVDLEGGAVLPFFVREAPVGSGRADGSSGYHGALALWVRLGERWLLQVRGDARTFGARFADQGERFGGVVDGESDDLFWTGLAGVERIF